MAMQAECPRCPSVLAEQDGRWVCPLHGTTAPLRRTVAPDYDSLVEHLDTAGDLPSWVRWPLPPGWTVTGFGAVRPSDAGARATVVSCGGMTEIDGSVSLTVVTEEPGTGLGARVSRWVHDDPGAHLQGRPVEAKVRVGGTPVPVWLLPTVTQQPGGVHPGDPWDRAVLAGESEGRWLWLVASPASAALGAASWSLEDLGARGPELVDLAFGRALDDW